MISKLTIIIPVYNEEKTVIEIINKVIDIELINNIDKEIIIIDDCSKDNSRELLYDFKKRNSLDYINIVFHKENTGKGGAVHSGYALATGEYCIIQDSDLELDPSDFNVLLKEVIEKNADFVYGSRFLNNRNLKISYLNLFANKVLTMLTRIILGIKITDMETCYKLIKTEIIKKINLKEKRFGFEPEITAKLAKIKGLRFSEVPIQYFPRNAENGKKIGWKDGFRAIYCILKYKFSD